MLGGPKMSSGRQHHHLKLKTVDGNRGVGGGRMRNDSGCFDDDCSSSSSGGGGGSPDFLSAHWDEVVAQWAGKNHSIVAQEAVRMKQTTTARRAELAETKDPKERADIASQWRKEVADIMATTQDLIQCVANDVTEVSLSSRDEEAEACFSSQDLGKIIEEELFDGDDDDDDNDDVKMFLVRTKRKRRQRRRRSYGGRRDSGDIEMDNGAFLRSEESFTIQVDRVQQERRKPDPMEREVKSGSWQWRKDLDSPTVWADDQLADNEVEDIFADWVALLQQRRTSRNFVPEDISEVFWTIGLEDRCPAQGRRFSEVLENLPFNDRPDILEDRCELLEGEKRRNRRFKQVRPRRMYWNIFSEWRKIFREEEEKPAAADRKKRARRRPRKKPRSMRRTGAHAQMAPPPSKAHGRSRTKKRPTLIPRRISIHVIEDYYLDFIHCFEEPKALCSRRRSLDLFDAQQNERNAKRIKLEQQEQWEFIRVEPSKSTLDALTKTIEKKIRAAFVSDVSVEEAAAACAPGPLPESLDAWPKNVARRIRKSRRRFEKLREKMRKIRNSRRKRFDSWDEMEAFEEWRWNMEEVEADPDVEDLFGDWAVHGMPQEAVCYDQTSVSKGAKNVRKLPNVFFFPKTMDSNNKRLNVRPNTVKKQNRLRVKSAAKQPRPRGFVSSKMN